MTEHQHLVNELIPELLANINGRLRDGIRLVFADFATDGSAPRIERYDKTGFVRTEAVGGRREVWLFLVGFQAALDITNR